MNMNSTRRSGDDEHDQARLPGMPFGRTRWAIAGIVLGVVGASWAGVGHRRPSTAEAGAASGNPQASSAAADDRDGTIDSAVRKVTQGIEDVSASVHDRFDRARGTSRNVALVAEVNARLRQDKSIDAGRIEVVVEEEGTVILKGQVPDNASKEIAVDLTRDIRGVKRVEDSLAVPPRRRVFATASANDPSPDDPPRRRR